MFLVRGLTVFSALYHTPFLNVYALSPVIFFQLTLTKLFNIHLLSAALFPLLYFSIFFLILS